MKIVLSVTAILLVVLLALSFSYGWPKLAPQYQAIQQIQKDHIEWASQNYGLSVSFSGAAMPYGLIKRILLGLSSKESVSVSRARIIYVDVTQDFLARINADPKVAPNLDNFPFTASNLGHSIHFYSDPDKTDPQVSFVRIEDGVLIYCRDDGMATSKIKNPPVRIFCETYEEALAIVKRERENAQAAN